MEWVVQGHTAHWRRRLACGLLALAAGLQATSPAADSKHAPSTGHHVYLFVSGSEPLREGFVRVINHSAEAGIVTIDPIDDAGRRFDPVILSIDPQATVHFNSGDLEGGNPDKGLSGQAGSGQGNWRLELSSERDIEVLSYIRTMDGFVTAMHDVAPARDNAHHVAIFNPGSNAAQVSYLRLINPTEEAAEITIRGTDDRGMPGEGEVSVSLHAGTAKEFSAAELESGGAGLSGRLGDGSGKWRLEVVSEQAIVAMSLLESPTDHLTNLSTVPVQPADGVHLVPLFPRAGDASGRQGFVRAINRSDTDGEIRIQAYEDTERDYDAVTLAIGPGEAAHFNSHDLEQGNDDKGLSGGIGAGEGDWLLELTSDLDIEVLSYIRAAGGFLTSMHDVIPGARPRHRVAIFNPGSNRSQESLLRIVAPGPEAADVTIVGTDDVGVPGAGPVSLTIPAGRSRTVGAWELESSGEGLTGMLGDGAGKWRLRLTSSAPILAMSLLRSPTGHLTNLSTTPTRGVGPAPQGSYELQKTVLHVDRSALREDHPDQEVLAVAYGDFDGDGDEDVFLAAYDGTEEGTPVEFYANDGAGGFALANDIFAGDVPELVHARKALPGDFNGDGRLDVFVAGHGYDREPFPGESPVLILSTASGLQQAEGLDDWVGFFHGAASADIDHDGDLDVVLTDFTRLVLLVNDGRGRFSEATDMLPPRGAFTTELIDVDFDGYVDLLVAGHEDDNPSEIYWGDHSLRYTAARRTTLPAVPGQDTVVDIDADDLDGDGVRDIVLTRTGGGDNFYQGYYIQLILGQGDRAFVDATENVEGGQSADPWIDWVRLQDGNDDGHRDIVVDDAGVGVVWVNDGFGRFSKLRGASAAAGGVGEGAW